MESRQELIGKGVLHREESAARGQGCLRCPEAKESD